jgi:hypothetical protein
MNRVGRREGERGERGEGLHRRWKKGGVGQSSQQPEGVNR